MSPLHFVAVAYLMFFLLNIWVLIWKGESGDKSVSSKSTSLPNHLCTKWKPAESLAELSHGIAASASILYG